MKTLKPGNESQLRATAWWPGLQLTCDRCGHMAELEYKDKVKSEFKGTTKDYRVTAKCAFCDGEMRRIVTSEEMSELLRKALQHVTPAAGASSAPGASSFPVAPVPPAPPAGAPPAP